MSSVFRRLHERVRYAPQPMSDAEIMYADVDASRLRELAKMIGGVMRPASIASACCSPHPIASNSGMSASSE